MKLIKRIPLEAYAYEELHFDNLEEYETEYPKYVEVFKKVRAKVARANSPFPDETIQLTNEEDKSIKY